MFGKVIGIYLLSVSIAHASIIEPIECEKFDESVALTIEQNKRYLKSEIKTSIVDVNIDKLLTPSEKKFRREYNLPDKPSYQDVRTNMFEIRYEAIDSYSGSYLVKKVIEIPDENKLALRVSEITPHVIFKINDGMLVASNRGEFGAEIAFIDTKGSFTLLGEIRVEDIYQMPFGVVVISGMAHMDSIVAEVHIFEPEGKLTKLFNLISAPRTSWFLKNGDLLINSPPEGSQVLTKEGLLKRVRCNVNK